MVIYWEDACVQLFFEILLSWVMYVFLGGKNQFWVEVERRVFYFKDEKKPDYMNYIANKHKKGIGLKKQNMKCWSTLCLNTYKVFNNWE